MLYPLSYGRVSLIRVPDPRGGPRVRTRKAATVRADRRPGAAFHRPAVGVRATR